MMKVVDENSRNIIKHYDMLVEQGNDPVFDPKPLKEYMDKWDGEEFINKMKLSKDKSVLEIGVGTGRLAVRVAPNCKSYCGVDISPKTIKRARKNLSNYKNIKLLCGDFLTINLKEKYEVVFSSLTFMHITKKQSAIDKVFSILNNGGLFVLSIDKNQKEYIDIGINKIKTFPDNPLSIKSILVVAGFNILENYQTELADIFVCEK